MPPEDMFFSASRSAKLRLEAKTRTSAIMTRRCRNVIATSIGMPCVGSSTSSSFCKFLLGMSQMQWQQITEAVVHGAWSNPLDARDKKIQQRAAYDPIQSAEFLGLELTTSNIHRIWYLYSQIKMKKENVRPFRCEECPRAFIFKSEFKRHKTRHHLNIRNEKCLVCDYSACADWEIKIHTKIRLYILISRSI